MTREFRKHKRMFDMKQNEKWRKNNTKQSNKSNKLLWLQNNRNIKQLIFCRLCLLHYFWLILTFSLFFILLGHYLDFIINFLDICIISSIIQCLWKGCSGARVATPLATTFIYIYIYICLFMYTIGYRLHYLYVN